jgi:tetratricopeptide (TPR) repeat protein
MFQTADSNNSIGHEIKSFGDVAGTTIITAREVALQPTPPAEAEPAFRDLVVVARPLDVAELPDIADQFELVRGLTEVEAPARLDILRPPTIEALRTALQRPPDLFHFDGHGVFGRPCPNEKCRRLVPEEELDSDRPTCPACGVDLSAVAPGGYLAFEQQDGTVDMLPAEELAEMLVDSPTRLVVLSACQSAMGEEAGLAGVLLAAGVPCVLAMRESVSVPTTLALLRPFYAALGAGKTARQAFDAALPALRRLPPSPLTDTPAVEIPVLMGDDQVCLVEPGTPPGTVRLRPEPLFGVPGPGESGFYGVYQDGREPRGRKGLLVRLARALLQGEKLVWLAGVGGIGKTVLAAVAARRLNWLFPGGVVWASAADVETFRLENLLDAFAPVFLPQMGMTFYQLPTEARQQSVLQYVRDLRTPTLVALDNAEVVEDPRVFRFLRTLPGHSAALVTGREAPEWGGCVVDVGAMEPDEGVRFLVREMQRARQDPTWGFVELWGQVYWRIGEQDRERLREVAERLDGHPLALLVAAGLMRTETLEGVLKAVRQNSARGEVGRRFDFSYSRLTESQQALLHRLAAFGSDVAPWAVDNLCTNEHLVGDDTLPHWEDDLRELFRRYFVEVLARVGVDEEGRRHELRRYRLHPVMRQYMAHKAGDEAMRVYGERMAHLFLAYAQQFKEDFNALEAEHANLLAAMDQAYELEAWQTFADLVDSIAHVNGYLDVQGHWTLAIELNERAAKAEQVLGHEQAYAVHLHRAAILGTKQGNLHEAVDTYQQVLAICRKLDDERGIAVTLHQMGMLAQDTGDYGQAYRLYLEAAAAFDELGARKEQAAVLHQLGVLAQMTGDYDQARRLYQEAAATLDELGARKEQAAVLHQLGVLAQATGDYDQARCLYQQSLDIKRQLGDKAGVAYTLGQLGNLAYVQGNLDEARQRYEEVLAVSGEMGDKKSIATTYHQLGMLAQDTGDYDQARRFYQQSLDIAQQLGNKAGVAQTLHQLGNVAYLQGDYDQARRLYQQSLDITQQLGDKAGVATTLHQLGMLAQATGDYDQARRLYQQSLDIEQQLGNKAGAASTLHQLGRLAQITGDYDQARRLYQQSLDIKQQLGDKDGIARSLGQLGRVAELEKDYVTAVRYWAQALEIFEALGAPGKEIVRGWFSRLRDELGEDRFNEVLEEAAKGRG